MTLHHPSPPLLRPVRSYTDGAAVNDIHALLTTWQGTDSDALTCVAELVMRTGRPMTPARDIEVTQTSSPLDRPVVHAESDGTVITICQDPAGPGLHVAVTSRDPADRAALKVTVDGRPLAPAPAGPVTAIPCISRKD